MQVPESLQGTWKGMLEGTTASSGRWTLTITENEMLLTNPHPGSDPFPIGLTAITDDQVTFVADSECSDHGPVREGKYSYVLSGQQLAFTMIDDSCGDRIAVVSKTPWERQP